MACSITVDANAVAGIQNAPGEPPSSIRVSGTAEGCEVVLVTLNATGQTSQVSAEVIDGQWTAIFNAPADFDPADWPCGLEDIKYSVTCKDDPLCKEDGPIDVLNCQPRDCPPQASLLVFRDGDPTDVVNPDECLPPGSYTVRVSDPFSTSAVYQWSLNGTTQPAASGSGQADFDLNLSADSQVQSVSVAILFSADCFLSAGVSLTPCDQPPPPAPDCPTTLTLAVSHAGSPVTDLTGCLEPGGYTISVTEPVGQNFSYSWSIDNVLQQGQTGSSFSLDLPAGETRAVQVSASRPDCPAVPGSVTLTACESEPQPECADAVTWQVLDNSRQPVQTGECLPPGSYTAFVQDPVGPGVSYTWLVDGQAQPGQIGRAFAFNLAAGQSLDLAVVVQAPGCLEIRDRITVTGCDVPPGDCADGVTLVVLDGGGQPVDASGCLPPGRYRVRVEAPAGAGVSYAWSLDDQLQPGATGQEFALDLAEGQSATVSVSAAQSGCGPLPGGVTLTGCTEDTPPPLLEPQPWCPLLLYGGLVLLIIGLVLIFAGFCTGNIPLIVLGGVLAAAGFGLLIAWALLCAPARGGCDLLRRLIQVIGVLTIILGVVAAIFGIIAAICAGIASPAGPVALICGLPGACGIGALIDFGIVGVLLAILTLIYLEICE